MFVNSERNRGRFAEDSNFEESGVNGVGEVGYLFQLEKEFSTSTLIFDLFMVALQGRWSA